jgi:hypothetical protein
MPESASAAPNLYALLIGIDNYKPNSWYKSLQGCVRDIALVDDFLKQTLQPPPKQIYKLLSPNPDNTVSPDLRTVEESIVLPTYANIVDVFKQITEQAQPKDLVYIHYSGHGGRAATLFEELKGTGQNDEGIVPMDIGEQNGQYLRDVELATLLKRMTDKGLVVTVILDSCHSGGATRGDCEIRGSNEIDSTLRSPSSLVASYDELVSNWNALTDGTKSSSWLPASRDYVLLAACRPTEYAYEYAVNGKDRHGALTYWMIDTLKSGMTGLTYKALHDRVGAKIQSKFPSQLPMLLGEGDRAVFGRDRVSLHYAVVVTDVNDIQTQVKLSAGLAQGLSSGTRLAVYPLGTNDFTDKQKQVAIVEITEVQASSSFARVLTEQDGGVAINGQIEQGASAVMLAAPTDLVRRVRLFSEKKRGDAELDLPTQTLVDQQEIALAAVRDALKDNGWVVEVQEGEEAHYQVAVGKNGEYEICIGMPLENLTPALMIGDPTAPKEVVKRLIHLAKYQAVQELDNQASELSDYLEFVLLDQNKHPFPDQSNITLKQGEVAYLRVKNTFPQALNVAVLDLEPTWEISQLPLRGIGAPFYQLAPQETVDTKLRFQVPDGKGYQQAKEMLKLFATRGAADFRWLTLPSLDEEIKRHEATRGLKSAFGKLLEAIGADPDQFPSLTRAAVYEPDQNAEWMTEQIQMTIAR